MTGLWSNAEKERQALQAEFARRATAQMLGAGALTLDSLTPQARRTLAWLAESDDPTVRGVADLLTAAYDAGRRAERARHHDDRATAPSDSLAPRIPTADGHDSPCADDQLSGRPEESEGSSTDHFSESTRGRVGQTADRPAIHNGRSVDQVANRLAALGQRGDDRAVEL